MKAQEPVQIVEVAPRGGFQAIKPFIPTHTKIAVVQALMEAKYRRLEVGAFVSPATSRARSWGFPTIPF